jgi:hypothetical protein
MMMEEDGLITGVSLRLAALPMDQCAARMLNLARSAHETTHQHHHHKNKNHEMPQRGGAANNNKHNHNNGDGSSSKSKLRLWLDGHAASTYYHYYEGARLFVAPVACVALHGVGLTWAPLLLMACLGSAGGPTLVCTVLALLTRPSLLLLAAVRPYLYAAWALTGAALVQQEHSHSGGRATPIVVAVLWLCVRGASDCAPGWDAPRAVFVAARALVYEGVCLSTGATPAQCWSRYGAVLVCDSGLLSWAVVLALLGAALAWRRVQRSDAAAAATPAEVAPANGTTTTTTGSVDALDVQEAFRLARAQYYLSGGGHPLPPSSSQEQSLLIIAEKNA